MTLISLQTSTEAVANPAMRSYAQQYLDIERDFEASVASFGLGFADEDPDAREAEWARRVADLERRGVTVANNGKSLSVNWISPSCVTCRTGMGTETFLASVQCPRSCYFCFNENQYEHDYYMTHVHDMAGELQQRYDAGVQYTDLAVTGGEPLLHKPETLAFYQKATELYPKARLRLYTSGAGLDDAYTQALKDAGLDEIRFSIKLDDPPAMIEALLQRIERCVGQFDAVMVEMPVMPDQVEQMKKLLVRLDGIGIAGINLLELCFPLHNADEFAKRGYFIKPRPYQVLYDWWYAGGLPIAGSGQACLDLLEFAIDRGLSMGVHYCSLENKFTGQVFQQNMGAAVRFPRCVQSERDYYLKTAKVFGDDVPKAKAFFAGIGRDALYEDPDLHYLEFPVSYLTDLSMLYPSMEVGISTSIQEERDGQMVLRELRIDATTPSTFDPDADL